jgi:hypothetical protein
MPARQFVRLKLLNDDRETADTHGRCGLPGSRMAESADKPSNRDDEDVRTQAFIGAGVSSVVQPTLTEFEKRTTDSLINGKSFREDVLPRNEPKPAAE